MPDNRFQYFWKKAPFIRLIIPFIAGILLEHYLNFSSVSLGCFGGFIVVLGILFNILPVATKYQFRWIPGFFISCLMIIIGAFSVLNKDIRNKQNWIGNYSSNTAALLITLKEPLVEKAKTYKAEASVDAIRINNAWQDATGNILVYFSKDTILDKLNYGSQVLLSKPLQQIKNSGNPGSFDYKQYTAFQNIHHQVFLKKNEYIVTSLTSGEAYQIKLYQIRDFVIETLQKYIKEDREAGVAEALLIGYREDLDKDLVQAYSNTGVVHIIAISGLHLGMIYASLVWLLRPFKRTKWISWVKPVVILVVLWVFTLLAGAVPSILRSAVMFSFIVIAETIGKKSSIYNTLASSAFVMLFINPYYLWDVGFQLSYAAVVSIIAFQRRVYNWFYFNNKIIDFFWKLTSVTIAAQILTIPIVFYFFHQFPLLFLVTNCIIVPLSSVILFAELILVVASLFSFAANFIGLVTSKMLAFMNWFIEYINNFTFAVYDGIQNSLVQTILLYAIIISICYWLIKKTKAVFFIGLTVLIIFVFIDAYDHYKARQQGKIVVYNIPKYNAIDFISGKQFAFVGDTSMLANTYLTSINLKPSRNLFGVQATDNLPDFYMSHPFYQFNGKRILLIGKPFSFVNTERIALDMIIVTHNPRLYIAELASVFECKMYVFDGSNSTWKINQWKKDCEKLHLRHYVTGEQGALVMDL